MPASSFFLQIFHRDGQIQGEATEHGFKGAIEVSSWDWSASDKSAATAATTTGTAAPGSSGSRSPGSSAPTRGTGNAGRDDSVEPTPIRFSKQTDRSSTRLMQALGKGEIFPSAKFTLRQELRFGTAAQEFLLELVLEDARLTSYTFGATASEHDVELSEQWSFAYKSMYLDFKNAPGRQAPGIGPVFEMAPGSNTPAPTQPQPSATQQQGQLNQQQKGMDQQQKAIEKLQQQIDDLRRKVEKDAKRT
jgi:type VI protein secretion system component Hcp